MKKPTLDQAGRSFSYFDMPFNMYLLPDFILQMENFIVCVIVYLWSLVQIGGVYVAGRPSRITRLNKNLTADLLSISINWSVGHQQQQTPWAVTPGMRAVITSDGND